MHAGKRSCRFLLAAALSGIALGGFGGGAGAADTATQTYEFNIPAETLSQALTDFSRTASQQIIFSQSVTRDRNTSGLRGRYTVSQAVDILLAGTDLKVETDPAGVLMVRSASGQQADGARSPDPAPADAAANPGAADTAQYDIETVVVTGTHLGPEYAASTPVQVITMDQALSTGVVGTQGIIVQSPAASGTEQFNNLLSAGAAGGLVTAAGTNANTLALRNLGPNRTLTLLNGRRLTPAGVGSQVGPVDLNVIPSSIIDRVEVLTDGASSIYGSDAIAGVVNIITRRKSNGLEASAFTDVPEHGGGRYYQAALFWGAELDKGYVNVAAQYSVQEALLTKQRAQTACRQAYVSDPSTGARLDLTTPDGGIMCLNHNPSGVVFDQVWYGGWFQWDPTLTGGPYPYSPYPAAALSLRSYLPDWVRAGRSGYPDMQTYRISGSPAYDNADVISPVKLASLYVSGAYEISNSIEAYGDILLNQRSSASSTWMFEYPTISLGNPNNTMGPALVAASGGLSNGNVVPQFVLPMHSHQNIDYGQITGGLRGTVSSDTFLNGWSWDVSAQYGHSYGMYSQNFMYADRAAAAGAPVASGCDPSLITVSGPVQCLSIPWLDPNFLVAENWTQAQEDFLLGDEKGHTTYTLTSLDGLLRGSLFALPAGSVDAALGYSVRFEYLDDVPGLNARNHNYFAFSTAGITKGSDTIEEVFGEVGVPVLSDLPLIHRLDLTASGRFTNYRSYGSGATYKVGGNWNIIPSVSLRATYGTSFRAPTLYELYLANQTSFFAYFDPCVRYGQNSSPTVQSRCAAEGFAPDYTTTQGSFQVTEGGGAGILKAETSTNLTYGAVYKPPFADLLLNLDYYEITVRNEVSTYGPDNIINQCYTLAVGYQSFCSKIARNPLTREIISVDDRLTNISLDKRRGIDLGGQYDTDFSFAHLTLRSQWTWTLQNAVQQDQTVPLRENNGFSGSPASTGWAELSARHGTWTVNYGFNFISSTNDYNDYYDHPNGVVGNIFTYYGAYAGRHTYGNSNDGLTVQELLKVPAYFTHYVSVTWQYDESATIQFGVKNLFDRAPPVIGFDSFTYRVGSVPGNLYDFEQRTFFLYLKKKF